MASQEPADTRTRFDQLSEGAQFDILVPAAADFDPTSLFKDGLPSRLSSAPSRKNLYFDETTQLNLILRTSLGERAVRSLLGSLEIVLVAHATDAVPQGQGNAASASGKHDLTSKTIPGLELSDVLFADEHTYIIWKPALQITRPRQRLQRPAICFTANLGLTANAINSLKNEHSNFLKSFEPLPGNVLEPLRFDSALAGSSVFLPEDRVTKVLPTSATGRAAPNAIRGVTKRAFPVVSALYTRIRYSTLPDAVVASLHLEASHLIHGSIVVDNASFEINDTDVRELGGSTRTVALAAGGETVRLYKLIPRKTGFTIPSPLTVRIHATVKIDESSSVGLETSWQTQVDLTKAALKPTYKWSRPLSGGPLQPRPSQAGSRPTSSDMSRAHPGDHGIAFNFGSPETVPTGSEVKLSVHCANRSGRARRFALVVSHQKRHHATKAQRNSTLEKTDLVASIFNAPQLARTKTADVLDINPDARIGPLPAGAVFETQMCFRALATGPLDLGVIRIVDLDTRQTIDVRNMPDIIAMASDGTSR